MSRGQKGMCIVAILALLGGFAALQPTIDRIRREKSYGEAGLGGTPPEEVATILLLGGFRAIAVDVLWIRADNLKEEKKFYELRALYELIAKLQPTFGYVWTHNGWNLAYNIANQWPTKEDKWKWVEAGIEFVKKGKRRNQKDVDITFYLGYIYFHKTTQRSSGEDFWYFRQELMKQGTNPYEEALKYYEEAALLGKHSLFPSRVLETQPYHVYRAWARYLVQEGLYEEALDKFEKAASGYRLLQKRYPRSDVFGRLEQEVLEDVTDLRQRLAETQG